ncbi:MAG: nucleotidyltransferase domain-containing protein, partial [Actinomycetota bacterium]|nr:nucleotidyltransferase domain-containing protein [Actinomycetota bacterium]
MAEGVRAVVERRRREQAAAFDAARRYAKAVAAELPVSEVVVFGSYARGDFNTWSDIDVLVISDQLPDDTRTRSDLLWRYVEGNVSPLGWTVSEHDARRRMRDPIAVEVDAVGVHV